MAKRAPGRSVVPTKGGGWSVKKPGSKRAESRHRTQAEAEQRAKSQVLREGGGEVLIQGRDGRIRAVDFVSPKSAWEIRRELRVTRNDLRIARKAIEGS